MLIGFILTLMLVIDCLAFHLISKDELSGGKQKILQTLLVVFVPFIGSLLVIFVVKAKSKNRDVEFSGGGND